MRLAHVRVIIKSNVRNWKSDVWKLILNTTKFFDNILFYSFSKENVVEHAIVHAFLHPCMGKLRQEFLNESLKILRVIALEMQGEHRVGEKLADDMLKFFK